MRGDSLQAWRGRCGGGVVHVAPGDDQLDAVPTLPQHLGHLLASHPVQVRVPDLQDVVPAVQTAILTTDKSRERRTRNFTKRTQRNLDGIWNGI